MELITIKRKKNTDKSCIGEVYFENSFFSNSMEDTVRLNGVKIQGQTAIPAGKYRIALDYSERFKKILPHILDVPNFTGIRVHAGNYAGYVLRTTYQPIKKSDILNEVEYIEVT